MTVKGSIALLKMTFIALVTGTAAARLPVMGELTVGVTIGEGVTVGVGVTIGVGTTVGVGAGVDVGVGATVGVGVTIGVGATVGVGAGVDVGVDIGVGVGCATSRTTANNVKWLVRPLMERAAGVTTMLFSGTHLLNPES